MRQNHANYLYPTYSGPCAFVPALVLFFAWPRTLMTFNRASPKRLDYVGAILVLGGTTLSVFIINQAAIRVYSWDSALVISVLIISGLCWVALVPWQWQLSRNPRLRFIIPQFPFRILTDRVMMSSIM